MCLTLAMTTDVREGRLSPSLNDHFEIRDRQEGSESKKNSHSEYQWDAKECEAALMVK